MDDLDDAFTSDEEMPEKKRKAEKLEQRQNKRQKVRIISHNSKYKFL